MNEFPGPIDRRPNARITRSALDEVKAIQTLLADVYKDIGGGRTLLRELVQNADDAKATRLIFVVVQSGLPEAHNSLLHGPALLVANDGPFPVTDREALHQAIGGAKAADLEKVGRFGMGLKSVFHICEAFVYLGAEHGLLRPGAVNPWAGTGGAGDEDPLHPDWDLVDNDDLQRILEIARTLFGSFETGFLQWIPLRRDVHLNRAPDRLYGLGQFRPELDEVAAWFGQSSAMALLLAQCGHLQSIEAYRVASAKYMADRTQLAGVVRPDFEQCSWVGRYQDDKPLPVRHFEGQIDAGDRAWLVVGVDACGADSLRHIREQPDWPSEPHWREGQCAWLPRKALAHAAITIIRPRGQPAEQVAARLRWAVFFPLDDDPNPRNTEVVETLGCGTEGDCWDIVLHGYFWPSHDRRSIPGVTDDDPGTGDAVVRARWNRALRDDLSLPLLPSALAKAVESVPEATARALLQAVAQSRTVKTHLHAVCRREVLLPCLAKGGVAWQVHVASGPTILSVPHWLQVPDALQAAILARTSSEQIVFIDDDAPRIGGETSPWPASQFESILSCVSAEVLQTPDGLVWTQKLLQHVLGKSPEASDARAAVAARWLAMRIGEDVLAATTAPASGKPKEEPRALWRRLFETLPAAWLVDVPVGSQSAVVELAKSGIVGPGLVPIPFGRRPGLEGPRPDRRYVDRALRELGKALQGSEGTTQRTQQARLLLAESLLSVRGDLRFEQDLERLPLLRARRLPDDRDEAWSMMRLLEHVSECRVFSRGSTDDEEADRSLKAASDPKSAVEHLAKAIGKPAWLVDATVGDVAQVPKPTEAALADAVLKASEIESTAEDRVELLRRLARDRASADLHAVRLAIRTLLTGRLAKAQKQVELFYVRSEDSRQEANRRTLQILLRLLRDSWRAVDAILVEPLPHGLVQALSVRAVDEGVLQRLLMQCLQQRVDWDELCDEEVLHLLEQLHGNSPHAQRNWRAMPLHRDHRGKRGPIDERTYRVSDRLRAPPELEAEVRLLNPDCQVAHLYAQIPILDHDGLLRAMLQSSAPERFADAILGALRSEEEGSVVLPRDPKLLELLRKTAWLPGRANGSPVAPEKLLILPGELHDSIAPLAAAGCLGDHRLVSAVDPGFWQPAEEAVRELIGKPAAATQLEQLSTALATDTLARVNGGAYLVFTDAARLTTALIENALQSPLCSAHQGWALLSAAAQALAIRGTPLDKAPESARKALVSLARRLCGPMPAEQQAATLNALATATPAHESPTYRLFCTLLDTFCQDSTFLKHVVSKLAALPTQDGQWRSPREIARSASGVAPRHLLVTALRKCLRLDSDRPAYQKGVDRPTSAPGVDTAQVLKSYFEPWRNMVPHQAIGLFLSLLGPGKRRAIVELAQRWLGEDVNIDGILQQVSTQLDVATSVRVFCSGVVASEGQVKALNPLGEWVEMETEPDSETLFAVDPQCLDHWRGDFWNPQLGDIEQGSSREAGSRQLVPFWHIQLRDVRPKQRTTHELLSLLRATVEWWGGRVLKLDQQSIRQWWSRYGESSQTQVQPVRASILAHLPLTLRQLDVRDSKPLAEALRKAERAQRAREQAPRKETQAAMDAERAALECLAQLVCDKKHQPFLLQRVRVLMERFGYREDSVLRELAQNADDALAQAAEIAGGPLPERARRLTIRVHKLDQTPTVDIIHYGRPINDTGGPAFPEGKERQWDLDLYFMMLLNLSTKPGEKPGEATAGSTTGRFGLGFKSVHLVSNCPSVVSGFLAFSIAGGLLPQKQRFPDDLELAPVDGHRPTRIRLPLRNDLANAELVDRMFDRFAYTRALLPAFARQVREVIVDEGPHAGASIFDGEPIKGAQGWTCSRTPVDLPGEGKWRILRFRPQDMTTTGESAKLANKANSRKQAKSLDTAHPIGPASTIALAVGLRDGLPAPFPEDFPFLWNVTPTSEAWACGYAINGPFKLDPGRTHVSLDDEATLQVVDLLGEALGNGLIALHQAILNDAKTAASLTSEPAKFLEQLWRVLTHGLNSEDPLRRKILLRLHKAGRGVSAWMSACSIVPSGLPAPFAQRLPPVRPDMIVEEACDGLANRAVCRALAQIDDLVSLLKDRPIVSSEVASRVRPLIALRLQRLGAGKLFEELVQSWDHLLTPERLHALRPLADEEAWQVLRSELPDSTWQSHLRARSVDKSRQPLSKLLLPPEALDARWRLDADIKDELLRAAFAPDSCILDPDYIRESADVAMFLRLRLRHKIDAATVAGWYDDLSSERQPAALRYLVHGHLRDEVLTHLVALERRPPWLRQYERVRKALDDLGEDEWRCQMLLAALFPDRFRTAAEPLAKPILSEAETRTFLQRLVEWWDDENVRRRVISDYEEKTWPAWLRREGLTQGLRDKSPDHWLALLVLGACQSLGRTREQQHRGFLEMVHCEGWWDVFRESGDDTSWMDVLRNWQDRTIARLEYLRWMSLFPSIYQFSRYWRTYCRLLISAQKRSANLLRVKSLLAPRSDETLSGAGQQFDAPPAPLDMGLHWVLRELVRLEVIQGEHLYPACWVPSEQVLRLLQRVGLEIGDDNLSNLEKAEMVFNFLADKLNTPAPHLHRAFDIPLRKVGEDASLQRRLGLED